MSWLLVIATTAAQPTTRPGDSRAQAPGVAGWLCLGKGPVRASPRPCATPRGTAPSTTTRSRASSRHDRRGAEDKAARAVGAGRDAGALRVSAPGGTRREVAADDAAIVRAYDR
jgi:hypothetical protein